MAVGALVVSPFDKDRAVPVVAATGRDAEVRGFWNSGNAAPPAAVVPLFTVAAHVDTAPTVTVAIRAAPLLVSDLEHADRADEVKRRVRYVDIRPILDKLRASRWFPAEQRLA